MLRAVLIDDERPALDELAYLLKENSVEVLGKFQDTSGVIDFVVRENPDVVFLDIELRGENGIDFGVELQNNVNNTSVIFVTAYPRYALEAFRAYPLDYMTKPVDEERPARTLQHLREVRARDRSVQCVDFAIRCFGGFEITCRNDKVKFPTKKACELLAYLLCADGSKVYRDETARILFDCGDAGKNANNLRVTLFRIKNAFHEAGIGNDRIMIRNDLSVCIDDGVCDIIDFQRFIRNNRIINAKNIAQAEQAADLVSGELLIDMDALWVTEKREWFMVRVEELFINMSVFYLSEGFGEKAETILLRLLELNPLSEQGFRRLIDLYLLTKNLLKYRSCCERYREMLHKEFGDKPSGSYTNSLRQ